MKVITIKAEVLKSIASTQKTVSRQGGKTEVVEFREFRVGEGADAVYANFFGKIDKPEYKFAYQPNTNPLAKGKFKCIDNGQARELTTIAMDKTVVVEHVAPKNAVLALLGL